MALVAAGFTTYVYSCEVPPDPGIDLAATIGAPACLMRDMVLKNQVLLGTVNVGPEAFASALLSLSVFSRRWPAAMPTLIADHYQPEQAPDLLLGRPTGIKSVIAFDNALT